MNKLVPLTVLLVAGVGIAYASNKGSKKPPLFQNPIFTYEGPYIGSFEEAKKKAPQILDAWKKCGDTQSKTCDDAREAYRELVIKYPDLARNPNAANPCQTINGKVICSGGR
jgi:hypothetical protein